MSDKREVIDFLEDAVGAMEKAERFFAEAWHFGVLQDVRQATFVAFPAFFAWFRSSLTAAPP